MNTKKIAETAHLNDLPMIFSPKILKSEDLTFFNEISKNTSQGLFPLTISRRGDIWTIKIRHPKAAQDLMKGADCISTSLRTVIATAVEAGYIRLIFDPNWLSALKQLSIPDNNLH